MRRVEEESKSCETCGTTMSRKRFGWRLEDLGAWTRRRFCSLSCANTKKQVGYHGPSQKALEGVLRELRRRLSASGTPQGQEPEQQHEWQHSDALCGLSRFGSSWEAGIERVGQKVPNRVDRLRALGNAVVPQVAEWIGRRIVSMEVSNNVSPKPS
jgi:site-specific DNA-cytosine methylase